MRNLHDVDKRTCTAKHAAVATTVMTKLYKAGLMHSCVHEYVSMDSICDDIRRNGRHDIQRWLSSSRSDNDFSFCL